jgi:hypothetical protein
MLSREPADHAETAVDIMLLFRYLSPARDGDHLRRLASIFACARKALRSECLSKGSKIAQFFTRLRAAARSALLPTVGSRATSQGPCRSGINGK